MIWLWIFGMPIVISLLAYWWEYLQKQDDITFDPPDGSLRLDERTTEVYRRKHRRKGQHGWREAND